VSNGLHSLTDDEAALLALRAAALQRFRHTYRHNPESERTMVGSLRRLAAEFSEGTCTEVTFPWELIVDADLSEELWSTVGEKYSVATATKDASALRRMLDCCRRVGLLTYEEYRHASAFTAKNVGTPTEPTGTFLAPDDIEAIVTAVLDGKGSPTTRVRDVALLLTLASCGARGWEVTGVQMRDLHLDECRIWLTRTKGGEARHAWLHPLAVAAIRRWLVARGPLAGPLFVPLSRTGRPMLDHGGLSTQQVRKIVHARAGEAGYTGVATHDLRRFLVSSLLQTNDIALVAKVVGHKNPATTAGYDRRPLQHQRDAVASLRLPQLDHILGTSTDATPSP
jgi:integrase/recombinase XerD